MAGLIPQPFIDDLLDRVDIVEIIDRRVKLRKSGKNYTARCPFHEEKTPSFSVNPEKQFYYCFGCGAGGNALGFLMDYENLEFPQAVESLADSVGLTVPREERRGGTAGAVPQQQHRDLYELLEKASRFFQHALRHHARAGRAVEYLKQRGLTGAIAQRYQLGFAPPGWDSLLNALGRDESAKKRLLEAGLLVENDAGRVYDRFRDRIIFPIHDQRGRVIGFGGRVLGDDKPKYLNSPETPVFHKGRELYGLYQARKANRHLPRILVVEGYMDVIALAQHDIGNATATLGTATSEDHLRRLYRQCPSVVFCFDGDDAGRQAAFRAMESALPCMEDGRQAHFLFLPEGEDPDTLVRHRGTDGFTALLDQATPLETFLFDSLSRGIDSETMEGKARLSKQVLPYIRKLPEGVFRRLMLNTLAERTGLSVNELAQLHAPAPAPATESTNENQRTRGPDAPRQRPPLTNKPRGHATLAQSAIALLLHQPGAARRVDVDDLAGLEGSDVELLRQVLQLLQRRPGASTATLLGHWYDTPEGELLNRLAGQERLIPREGVEQQFLDTVAALSRLPHKARMEEQLARLRQTDYASISELEKQRLRELLQTKQLKAETHDKDRNGGS